MTDAEVLEAIRANHLKANIGGYEKRGESVIHWERAYLDSLGPESLYAHVPITLVEDGRTWYEIVVRVYPPERAKKRLLKSWTPPKRLRDALAKLQATGA